MLVSNLHAGSVSARTKEVIVKALQADFKLEVADTIRREHASDLARDAVDRDFQAVLAFGGDGTINEVVQGLAETDLALGILPGGTTNVMARSLGIPADPVEATAFVAARLRSGTRRRINLGRINERYFVFSAGMGLDGEVVRRVEAAPERKRRSPEWLFVSNAFRAGLGEYRGTDAFIKLRVDGDEPQQVMTAVFCNARPFTYFRRFPIDVCPQARLDAGIDAFGLKKLRTTTVPRLVWAVFVSRSHVKWRSSYYRHDVAGAEITATRPAPMQVDGDYLGEHDHARVALVHDALDILV